MIKTEQNYGYNMTTKKKNFFFFWIWGEVKNQRLEEEKWEIT